MAVSPRLVGGLLALSWVGLVVHNVLEAVDGSSVYMALVAAIFFLTWVRSPMPRLGAGLLIFWGLAFLGVAVLTAIPFAFLPFVPRQTLTHYLAHLFWAAVQLPLIAALARELSR